MNMDPQAKEYRAMLEKHIHLLISRAPEATRKGIQDFLNSVEAKSQ